MPGRYSDFLCAAQRLFCASAIFLRVSTLKRRFLGPPSSIRSICRFAFARHPGRFPAPPGAAKPLQYKQRLLNRCSFGAQVRNDFG